VVAVLLVRYFPENGLVAPGATLGWNSVPGRLADAETLRKVQFVSPREQGLLSASGNHSCDLFEKNPSITGWGGGRVVLVPFISKRAPFAFYLQTRAFCLAGHITTIWRRFVLIAFLSARGCVA
jgi:hypothetical protein